MNLFKLYESNGSLAHQQINSPPSNIYSNFTVNSLTQQLPHHHNHNHHHHHNHHNNHHHHQQQQFMANNKTKLIEQQPLQQLNNYSSLQNNGMIEKVKRHYNSEVDPARYRKVLEEGVTKFACSLCGNTYKWRKSLNKHWKEKHITEIPPPLDAPVTVKLRNGNTTINCIATSNGNGNNVNTNNSITNNNILAQSNLTSSPVKSSHTSSLNNTSNNNNNPFVNIKYENFDVKNNNSNNINNNKNWNILKSSDNHIAGLMQDNRGLLKPINKPSANNSKQIGSSSNQLQNFNMNNETKLNGSSQSSLISPQSQAQQQQLPFTPSMLVAAAAAAAAATNQSSATAGLAMNQAAYWSVFNQYLSTAAAASSVNNTTISNSTFNPGKLAVAEPLLTKSASKANIENSLMAQKRFKLDSAASTGEIPLDLSMKPSQTSISGASRRKQQQQVQQKSSSRQSSVSSNASHHNNQQTHFNHHDEDEEEEEELNEAAANINNEMIPKDYSTSKYNHQHSIKQSALVGSSSSSSHNNTNINRFLIKINNIFFFILIVVIRL